MAGLGSAFAAGENTAEQLFIWQVLAQIVAAGLTPLFNEIARLSNKGLPSTPLTPAELAEMVVRNIIQRADAEDYATQSGIAPTDFTRLVQLAGNAPSPQELELALRRKIIPEAGRGPDSLSFEQGIAEGRIRDKWTDFYIALGHLPVPPADAVDAVVKGQVDYAQGEAEAAKSGIDADVFRILFNTRGNPPSPVELAELLRRGFIPLEGVGPDVLSFQQGIFEGATKNKWWQLFSKLADYIPPPRTVTAMVREGALTDDEALALFKQSGLSQSLAAAYLHAAHHQKLAASKDLAKADVETLYRDRVISASDATSMLGALGYTAQESAFLLALQDIKRAVAELNAAIGRIHTLYVNRKIDKAAAVGALNSLHVPPAQVDQLLPDWDVERTSNVKVLTAAEITSAFFYKIIDQAVAQSELEAIGYTPLDAWILLSVRQHGKLPNQPAAGPSTSGG